MAMELRNAVLAESEVLAPMTANLMYQYVVAGNGLFIRAEDSRMEAMVLVTPGTCYGLIDLEPYARLKVPKVPAKFLWAVLQSARKHLPDEAMYQLKFDGEWRCIMPNGKATAVSLEFDESGDAVVDLHSHGTLGAFFSLTDDEDEKGLRFYCVVGQVDGSMLTPGRVPQIAVRVGVYGHTMTVDAETVFEGLGPFVEVDPDESETTEEGSDAEIEATVRESVE